jgi:Protein of unknown function (DUF1638)
MTAPLLVIACGAIARELVRIKRGNQWEQVDFQCLPPSLHNHPGQIVAAIEEAIVEARDDYERIFVAYGDCGTGGLLDKMLARHNVERLPGAHCYEFFAGSDVFGQLVEEVPGSFYLTDFLVRHFRRLVIVGLGLDRHPQLLSQYFGNYQRVVYLAQAQSAELESMARGHAAFLRLDYEYRYCGDQTLTRALGQAVAGICPERIAGTGRSMTP